MKKLAALGLCIALMAHLAACGAPSGGEAEPVYTAYTMEELAAAVISGQDDLPRLYATLPEDSEFDVYAGLYLSELSGSIEDGIICYPVGPLATEVTIFRLSDAESAELAREPLEEYIAERDSTFFGYAPQEAELARNGHIVINGQYAALFICQDGDAAEKTFLDCFGDSAPPAELDEIAASLFAPADTDDKDDEDNEPVEPSGESGSPSGGQDDPVESPDEPPDEPDPSENPQGEQNVTPPEDTKPDEPPNNTTSEDNPPKEPTEEEIRADDYDHDAVVAAWQSGDYSSLGPKNRIILDICANVIEENITPDMSDYDKELALHDWIVSWANYDDAELSHGLEPDPDNDNPYGVLVGKRGICLGYSSTFQLFMDMAGIECITVQGFAHDDYADHAWNMVRLDGEWYCVDATWDDPVFSGPVSDSVRWLYAHDYFNVTSDYMRMTGHYWDETDVPEAEATLYSYDG